MIVTAVLPCVTPLSRLVDVRSPTILVVAAIIPVSFQIAGPRILFVIGPLFYTAVGAATIRICPV